MSRSRLEPNCKWYSTWPRNTQAYYDALAKVGRGSWQPANDARPSVRFTITAHLRQARTMLTRVREADRL